MAFSKMAEAAAQASRKKKGVVLGLTRGGNRLARSLAEAMEYDHFDCRGQLQQNFTRAWTEYDSICCIMATGIVVRTLAPLLRDKYTDPAVVVCDEQGGFAISLISGHIGGGNALAHDIARLTGGQAVITTASDVKGKIALDLWCRDMRLIAADKKKFTAAMAKLVDTGSLALFSDYPLPALPPDLLLSNSPESADLIVSCRTDRSAAGCILYPPALVMGIGCKRGTTAAAIREAVTAVCKTKNIAVHSLCGLASIDIKRDEQGLLTFAREQGLEISFFSSEELNQVPGVSVSDVVFKVTGAKGVAEPAALLQADRVTLLVKKMKWPGVTTAIAELSDPFKAMQYERNTSNE